MSIELAKQLAYRAHEGQFRKYNGKPYIVHPAEVAAKVDKFCRCRNLSEDQTGRMVSAAWLHDVLEDCPHITEAEIIEATDEATLQLVKELTNPSKGAKAPRHVRKQMDRDHIANASQEAKIIKLYDRILNLCDMYECGDKEFILLYTDESLLLLKSLEGTDSSLENALGFTIAWTKFFAQSL